MVSSDIFVINDTWIGRHPRETSQHFHFAETVRLNTTSQGLEGIGATSRFSMQFFAQEQFVRMKLGTAPLARHYNKMKQVPDLTVNAENCGAMTTILVRICGAYGLGRVMACDLNQASRQMIVLQW